MEFDSYLALTAVLILGQTTDVLGQCSGSPLTLTATASKKYMSYPSSGSYPNSTDCTWKVTRSISYPSSSYFLEITWQRFDLRGHMPSCTTDYIEIFVGSAYRSIGRFCSSNIFGAMPFNVYAYDGYVKIVFHSDSTVNGAGFRIGYEMRYLSSQNLGYPYSTTCRNTLNLQQSGNVYSTKFPKVYSSSLSDCKQRVTQPKGNRLKIVFMHFDLENPGVYCSSLDDYVKIYGSETSTIIGSSITSYLCGYKYPFSYTSSFRNTWLTFHRRIGGSTFYTDRGYVAGYLAYDVPEIKPPGKSKIGAIIGGVIAAIVIIIIIVAAVVYWMKMKSRGLVPAANVVVHQPQEPPKRKKSSSSSSSSSSSDSDSGKKKKKHKNKANIDPNANPASIPGYPAQAYPPPQQAGYPPPQAGYPPPQAGYPPPQYAQNPNTASYPAYNMPNQPPVYT